jgi:hypothetical protein
MGNLLTDDLEQVWTTGAGQEGRQRYLRDCQGVKCPCQGGANQMRSTVSTLFQ